MRSTSANMIMPSQDHARAVQDSDVPPQEPNACVRLTTTLTDETKTKLNSDETETEMEDRLTKQSNGEQLE
jgi:hypothetical protein